MDTIQSPKSIVETQSAPEMPSPSTLDIPQATPVPPGTGHGGSRVLKIAALLSWFKHVFDYLGGSREKPPAGLPLLASPWWLGLWWGLMIGLILLFCGQTSKFIYIDF